MFYIFCIINVDIYKNHLLQLLLALNRQSCNSPLTVCRPLYVSVADPAVSSASRDMFQRQLQMIKTWQLAIAYPSLLVHLFMVVTCIPHTLPPSLLISDIVIKEKSRRGGNLFKRWKTHDHLSRSE